MITVVLYTYNRLNYAKETLNSLMNNIDYSGKLNLHIADDGSPKGYVDELLDFVELRNVFTDITWSNSNRNGYGASHNLAMQHVLDKSNCLLLVEDDWVLIRRLNLDYYYHIAYPSYCVRLGYLGWTQTLKGTLVKVNSFTMLKLDEYCAEPHVFAAHPRLVGKQWQENQGKWPENMSPGDTEFKVAQFDNSRINVLWPLNSIHTNGDMFVHIGKVKS